MLADETRAVAAAGPAGIDVATGRPISTARRPLRWKLCALLLGLPVQGFGRSGRGRSVAGRAGAGSACRSAVAHVTGERGLLAWTRRRAVPLRGGIAAPPDSARESGHRRTWILFVVILLFGCIAPLDWVNRLVRYPPSQSTSGPAVALPIVLILAGGAARFSCEASLVRRDYDRPCAGSGD